MAPRHDARRHVSRQMTHEACLVHFNTCSRHGGLRSEDCAVGGTWGAVQRSDLTAGGPDVLPGVSLWGLWRGEEVRRDRVMFIIMEEVWKKYDLHWYSVRQ